MAMVVKLLRSGALNKCNAVPTYQVIRKHWNKDWKPGPYPKTEKEREAAAKKYGLPPELYEPYPDDGMGYGDYPKLPEVSGDSRDPYYPWDFPEHKRNYNEPLHVEFDMYGEDRYDVSGKPRFTGTQQALTFIGVVGGFFAVYYLLDDYKMFRPVEMLQRESETSAKKYQNWPWAQHLEFLNDMVSFPPTSSNVECPDDTEREEREKDAPSSCGASPQLSMKQKRKEMSQDLSAVLGYLREKESNKRAKLDHVDNLFLSYAHTFKNFPPRTQAILKMKLAQLFGEAELDSLDERLQSPVTISSQNSMPSSASAEVSSDINVLAKQLPASGVVHYTFEPAE